jgi:hypothetical protein
MRKWLFASLVVLACQTARAAERGFYFGAGMNRSEIGDASRGPLSSLDFDETAWKAIAGIRPLDFLAAELTYTDLKNRPSFAGSAEATALSAWAIGLFPLPLVDLYGKVGIARWELDSFPSPCPEQGGPCLLMLLAPRFDSGRDVAYGVGAQAKLKRLAVRLEYERFDIDYTDGAEVYTLGITWTF